MLAAASPDFSKFMAQINKEDLARPNLFLIRFGSLLNGIMADGVLDLPSNGGEGGFIQGGINSVVGNVSDGLLNAAANTEIGGIITGAYSPTMLDSILGEGNALSSLQVPAGLDLNTTAALLCKAATIPGTTLEHEKIYTDRKPFTSIKSRTIDSVTLTFYATSGMKERNSFLAWMESAHNPAKNTIGFYDSIIRDVEILPLTRKGENKSITKCTGCFPVRVGPMAFDMDTNNAVATFEVEFCVATVSSYASFGGGIIGGTVGEIVGDNFGSGVGDVVSGLLD